MIYTLIGLAVAYGFGFYAGWKMREDKEIFHI